MAITSIEHSIKFLKPLNKFPNYVNDILGQTGLNNCGNTCYINSILQCLLHSPLFIEYISSNKNVLRHLRTFITTKTDKKDTKTMRLAIQFVQLAIEYWSDPHIQGSICPKKYIVKPTLLCKLIQRYYFEKSTAQQDAQEFLVMFLTSLHKALSYKLTNSKWKATGQTCFSPILDLFSGRMETVSTCINCNHMSYKEDMFQTIILPVEKEKSVTSLLMEYFSETQFDKDNLYKCESCEKSTQATQANRITKYPKNMIITFKRFKNNGDKNREKIGMCNEIDITYHDTVFGVEETKHTKPIVPKKYGLYGVVCHGGRTRSSGHYYSYCLNRATDVWYCFNDNKVYSVDLDDILTMENDDCYILFYKLL